MTVAVNKLAQVYPRLMHGMNAEDRAYVAEALLLKRVEARTRILEHGKRSDCLYMVAEGDLAVSLPADGDSLDLGKRGAGSWVGELGMIEPGPASATVDAATDVTLWVLTHDAFEKMRTESPCAAARVMEEVSADVAMRLRRCRTVLFRRGEDGHVEVVPSADARGGVVSRLLHEIKDMFALGEQEPRRAPAEPPPPETSLTLEALLEGHPSFQRLSAEDRAHMAQACEVRDIQDGHAFIREGEARNAVYFILEGTVEVVAHKPQGASFAVDRFMQPGEIIGLIALVDRGPRSATCRARGPVKLGVLTLEGANLLMNTRAKISCAFQYALACQLAHDARSLNESLLYAAAHPE